MDRSARRDGPRVLLVGYNGANNTGAEALLQADLRDLRSLLPDAQVTVPTLSEANLRRYLKEGPDLRIEPMPTIFFRKVERLVRDHDLVMLVEGSAYMDTWTSALLWYFLWATHCARSLGKPCLAYAVDAGDLSPLNRWLVRRVASRTGLIVTRARAAAERLRSCGVTAPIEVTADNALTFEANPEDEGWVERDWSAAKKGAIGLAVVDFHLWPVVIRPWGRREDCYRWPYYFSRSPEREQVTARLAQGYADLADGLIGEQGRPVALICMEQLDEPLARRIHGLMKHPEAVRVFSSSQCDASQMTALLQTLGVLATSRYHAAILSLRAHVPQVAVGHDLRLKSLYGELGLEDDYFLDPDCPDLWSRLQERLRQLLADPEPMRERLRRGHEDLAARAAQNRPLLRRFLTEHGWAPA
ncbi:MAG: polysaccharide pyruvyl transferase family protein [Anaerolineae bacterium]|nr:polysaccharide pyruvyl transferase family protein [Anaerolineae bacterium]